MKTAIRTRLFALQDPGYRAFHSALIPTVAKERVIGVRVPELRKLARTLSSAEAEAFLCSLPHRYYEEDNLHAILLSSVGDFSGAIRGVDAFLPYVDNWATCDMLSPAVFRTRRTELLPWIDTLLASAHPYTVRFGIDMLMTHFLDTDFTPGILRRVAAVRSDEYYVTMAAAWFFATALAKQYPSTVPSLAENRLSDTLHRRTIQKAVESRRIPPERKAYLKTLRRGRCDEPKTKKRYC